MKKLHLFTALVFNISVLVQQSYATTDNNPLTIDDEILLSNKTISYQQLKNLDNLNPEQKIANYIKNTLCGMANKDAYNLMARHFRQLKLLDQQDKWAPGLEGIVEKLLPKNVSVSDFETLVDQMAVCAARNPYLHRVVEKAVTGNLEDLYSKVAQEGKYILPNVVAYAMALNNLTVAMRNDIKVAEICHDLWNQYTSTLSILSHPSFGLFNKIKLLGFVCYNRKYDSIVSQQLDPDDKRYTVPINILEVTLADAFSGNFNNAYAGWVLAKNPPGGKVNAATGAGPATFSADGQAISIHMPFEKKWADLYSAWILGFFSRYGAFPYLMTHLLIPQVNNYENAPGEYTHTRVLALITTINFGFFGYPEIQGNIHSECFDWKSRVLTKVFGKINAQSAREYQAEVDKASTRNGCFSRCSNFVKSCLGNSRNLIGRIFGF